MISNSEIKFLRSLREKKYRDESGCFIVEGEKLVKEALDSKFTVEGLWRTSEIGEEAMSRISMFTSPSPVLALVRRPEKSSFPSTEGLCVALDDVRDPGNMGTIIRLSEWFGASAVFASPGSVEFFNPKVIQSSMGSIFRIPLVSTDLPQLCRRFRDAGSRVLGTFLDGNDIYASELPSDVLVVMGNEANGISAPVAAETDSRVFIPPFGISHPESLNVAMATAVTLSEIRRQNCYKKITSKL